MVYVLADMAGQLESPSYAISDVSGRLKSIKVPYGYSLNEEYTHQPELEDNYSLKWDGEWQITFEVFRDLGIAFAVVIIMIYILIGRNLAQNLRAARSMIKPHQSRIFDSFFTGYKLKP